MQPQVMQAPPQMMPPQQPQVMPGQPPMMQQPPPQVMQAPGQPPMMQQPPQMMQQQPMVEPVAGQPMQPGGQPMQVIVKQEIGAWQICEDAQGEYYVYLPSGQTFDNMPPELAQLLQQSGMAPQMR